MTFDKVKDISFEKDDVIYDLVTYDVNPETDYVVLYLRASMVEGMVDAENGDTSGWMDIEEFNDASFITQEVYLKWNYIEQSLNEVCEENGFDLIV